MDLWASAGLCGAALLAFANGANDISKSIATLVGSGESDYRRAVVLTSLAVAAGAIMASAWAVKMTLLFTKGMLMPQAQIHQIFAMAVLAGAIGWVLLATKLGLPVSTTHAIVGSVILTAVYAFGFDSVFWSGVTKKVALPLLLSPVLAFGLAHAALAAIDEEGHLFPRGEAVEVCTDTAAKLSAGPYAGQFTLLEPDGSEAETAAAACCAPGADGARCC